MKWVTDEFGTRSWTHKDHNGLSWIIVWFQAGNKPTLYTKGDRYSEVAVTVIGDLIQIQHEACEAGPVTLDIPFVVMATFIEAQREVVGFVG